jgi:hypothetical protein
MKKGNQTPRANDWRSDVKYQETCTTIINEIYPNELVDLYSGSDIDKNSVKEWFMHTGQLGESSLIILYHLMVWCTTKSYLTNNSPYLFRQDNLTVVKVPPTLKKRFC